MSELDVVTGAFSYTGKYITRRLLSVGKTVKTLTRHPSRPNPFGERVSVAQLNFDDPGTLARNLRGASTLYNTYWVRFPYGRLTFEQAITNTKRLIDAAEAAGVRRIVHISVTHASEKSPFPYFRGKGIVERAIIQSGLSYAIVRPTVIYGAEDILINNIAWLLRRFPMFPVAGSGDYQIQPVFAEDVAAIAVSAAERGENLIIDAAGPENYTYTSLVRLIADAIHSKAKIIHVGSGALLLLSKLVGYIVNDVVLTKDELGGLMANLLVSNGPPTGQARLSDWLPQHTDSLGTRYASELNRHYR